MTTPRPFTEWHEDMGPQLWWCLRDGQWLGKAPYVGSPLDLGDAVEAEMILRRHGEPELKKVFREQVGGWPGYHTHFTPLPPMPDVPK